MLSEFGVCECQRVLWHAFLSINLLTAVKLRCDLIMIKSGVGKCTNSCDFMGTEPLREPYVDSWSSPGQKPQPHTSRLLCGWSWFASIRQGIITGTPGFAPSSAAALTISPRFRYVSKVNIVRSPPLINLYWTTFLPPSTAELWPWSLAVRCPKVSRSTQIMRNFASQDR